MDQDNSQNQSSTLPPVTPPGYNPTQNTKEQNITENTPNDQNNENQTNTSTTESSKPPANTKDTKIKTLARQAVYFIIGFQAFIMLILMSIGSFFLPIPAVFLLVFGAVSLIFSVLLFLAVKHVDKKWVLYLLTVYVIIQWLTFFINIVFNSDLNIYHLVLYVLPLTVFLYFAYREGY